MNNKDFEIWKEYSRTKIIYQHNYFTFYKVINNKTNEIFVIKQIDQLKYKNFHSFVFNENKINNLIDNTLIFDIKKDSLFYYIIMKYKEISLKNYLKIIKKYLSYDEIKQILLKINENINNLENEIDISTIILPLDTINYDSIKIIKEKSTKDKLSMSKNKIYNIGEILYFILYHKFPKDENKIILQTKINSISNNNLKQLLNGILNNKLNWDEYINNSFFIEKKNDYLTFNLKCKIHSNILYYYCLKCKKNICDSCLIEHLKHPQIPFSDIGLDDYEINKIENLYKEINENIENLNKMKNKIDNILKKIKEIKTNKYIYENNQKMNFKNHYFNILNLIKEKTIIENNIDIIDFSEKRKIINSINCEFEINEENKNKLIQILNFDINQIKEMYLDDKQIDICTRYKFDKEKNNIKIIFENNLENLNDMFSQCSSLKSLNLSNFNTNNVKHMSNIFPHCSSLINLNLSNFNTNNVIEMDNMFSECSSLTSLNLSNFNTNNVTNMNRIFYNCKSLISLNLSNFNTKNVNDMEGIFYNCSSLTSLNLSNFNTKNVTDMSNMFCNCSSLTSLNLSHFNTKNVTNMNWMFYNCKSLNSLNLSNFNTSKTIYMNNMFANCNSLNNLDISNFNTNEVINMSYMFYNCSSLINLNLSNFNTSKVINMSYMFTNCRTLISLNLSNFNTNNVFDMDNMFSGCSSLTSLNLSNFNTNNVKNMNNMFSGCSDLSSLNLSNFNTDNVTNMNDIFLALNNDCEIITDDNNILDLQKSINLKY